MGEPGIHRHPLLEPGERWRREQVHLYGEQVMKQAGVLNWLNYIAGSTMSDIYRHGRTVQQTIEHMQMVAGRSTEECQRVYAIHIAHVQLIAASSPNEPAPTAGSKTSARSGDGAATANLTQAGKNA